MQLTKIVRMNMFKFKICLSQAFFNKLLLAMNDEIWDYDLAILIIFLLSLILDGIVLIKVIKAQQKKRI